MPSELQNEARQRASIKRPEPSKVPEGKSPPVKIGIIEKVKITLAIRSILMKKASWKTTLGGILLAASPLVHALPAEYNWVGGALAFFGALVLGTSARDNSVTSEQAGVK